MHTPSGQPSDLDGHKPYLAMMVFVSAKKLEGGGYEVISPYRDEPTLMGTDEFEAQFRCTEMDLEVQSVRDAAAWYANESQRLLSMLENLPK